jgi:hypothetical protein
LAVEKEVLQYLTGLVVSDKSAHRDMKNEVLSVSSSLIFSFAVGPFWGTKWFRVSKIEKG